MWWEELGSGERGGCGDEEEKEEKRRRNENIGWPKEVQMVV